MRCLTDLRLQKVFIVFDFNEIAKKRQKLVVGREKYPKRNFLDILQYEHISNKQYKIYPIAHSVLDNSLVFFSLFLQLQF
jgi:hypothetical protein